MFTPVLVMPNDPPFSEMSPATRSGLLLELIGVPLLEGVKLTLPSRIMLLLTVASDALLPPIELPPLKIIVRPTVPGAVATNDAVVPLLNVMVLPAAAGTLAPPPKPRLPSVQTMLPAETGTLIWKIWFAPLVMLAVSV